MIHSVDTFLATERLVLRRFTADDADLLIELDSDRAVMHYLTGGEPTPPELVRERILPRILAGYEKWDGELGLFAAHEKDGGAFIGWFCLRPEDQRHEVELGYRLRRDAWGHGYATEASRMLLAEAFGKLGVHTVWAETMSANQDSRNILDKLAMKFTGAIPTPPDMANAKGAEHGGVRYEITEEQWREAAAVSMARLQDLLRALPIRDVLAYTAAKHSSTGGAKVRLDMEQAAEFEVVDAISDEVRFCDAARAIPDLVPMCLDNIAIGVRLTLSKEFPATTPPPVRVVIRQIRPDMVESNEMNHRIVGGKAVRGVLERAGLTTTSGP